MRLLLLALTLFSPLAIAAERQGSIAAGALHTCAAMNGALYCWGLNNEGELGTGDTTSYNAPKKIEGIEGVTKVAATDYYSCAIAKGGAYCWGKNLGGRLGTGDRIDRLSPAPVKTLESGVTDIATGRLHACAVVNGGVKCWGSNVWCGLGIKGCKGPVPAEEGKSVSRETPDWVQRIPEGSGATRVSIYDTHTCAVVRGGAYCWGLQWLGTVGSGERVNGYFAEPNQVYGLPPGSGVTEIAAGEWHTCAVVKGGLQCWGRSIFLGQEGRDGNNHAYWPIETTGMESGVSSVSAAIHNTCAVKNGEAYCWGSTSIGNGQKGAFWLPQKVIKTRGATAVENGWQHNCALDLDGVRCWGADYYGQMGSGGEYYESEYAVLVLPW